MIIDFHVHTFPDKLAPKVMQKLSAAAGIEPQTDATISGTLNKMREWGVDRAVLLNIATAPSQQTTINNVGITLISVTDIFVGVLFEYGQTSIFVCC